MNALALDIVTPASLTLSQDVDMVVVPGAEGDFGVLYGHAPVISSIRPGVIRTYDKGEIKKRILVTGGFAEVTNERCTILATEVFDFDDTDRVSLEERVSAMKKVHKYAKSEAEQLVAESNLSVAQQALDAFILELDAS